MIETRTETDEIVDLVQEIYQDNVTGIENYAIEVTEKICKWMDENNVPVGLRHAILCYAHVIAIQDVSFMFSIHLASQDYDS